MMRLTYEKLIKEYYHLNGRIYRRGSSVPSDYISEHNSKLYMRVSIDSEHHYAHRLIFWMEYGYLPDIIDHTDQNSLNNDPLNLRDISHSLNLLNCKVRIDNASGVTGVRWNKNAGKWVSRVTYKGKEHHLGLFTDFDEAVATRKAKVDEFFAGSKNSSLFQEIN